MLGDLSLGTTSYVPNFFFLGLEAFEGLLTSQLIHSEKSLSTNLSFLYELIALANLTIIE